MGGHLPGAVQWISTGFERRPRASNASRPHPPHTLPTHHPPTLPHNVPLAPNPGCASSAFSKFGNDGSTDGLALGSVFAFAAFLCPCSVASLGRLMKWLPLDNMSPTSASLRDPSSAGFPRPQPTSSDPRRLQQTFANLRQPSPAVADLRRPPPASPPTSPPPTLADTRAEFRAEFRADFHGPSPTRAKLRRALPTKGERRPSGAQDGG